MDRGTNSKGTGGTKPKHSNSISGGSASRKRKAKKAFEGHSTGEGTGGTKPKNSHSISGGSASRKRKAKKAFEGHSTGEGTGGTKPKNSNSISGGSASRKRKDKKAFDGHSTGTGGTKPKNSNSISGGSASRKRKAEQAFEGHSTGEVPVITVEDDEVKSGQQSDGEAPVITVEDDEVESGQQSDGEDGGPVAVKYGKDEFPSKQSKLSYSADVEMKTCDNTSPVYDEGGQQKPQTSTKRKVSEPLGDTYPREDSDDEWNADTAFSIDCSSDVSEEERKTQIHFVTSLAACLNVTSGNNRAALIAYGAKSETLIPLSESFSCEQGKLQIRPGSYGEGRRMESALVSANKSLEPFEEEKHKILILITFGQQSWNNPTEKDSGLLSTTAESLQKNNVKVIIVSVGNGVNFQELVQMIERPHQLFPVSFKDLTQTKAREIVEEIKKTTDIVKYTTKKVMSFSGVDPKSGLREKIIDCLDVMEGTWNILYQPKNSNSEVVGKAKKRIQESLNDFHRLVLDSNIIVNLAAFGTEGVGKSSLLNFLLNGGVPESWLNERPLPSGKGSTQTALPIYVKYTNNMQVLLHKGKEEITTEVLYPNSNLEDEDKEPLNIVRDIIRDTFDKEEVLEASSYLELQGPFSIFHDLEETRLTSSGHLEFHVNVQLVDLPGLRGDQKGNKALNVELSKADVILFFTSGQEGREITSHDLANIFRQHGKFNFPSRPKLIHIVKATASDNFDSLLSANQKALEDAWSVYFEADVDNVCYKEAREKLPKFGGEDLLKKLKDESEVLVFHPTSKSFLQGLKKAISSHIENVKMKNSFHPSLKQVHLIAKQLNKTISPSKSTAQKVTSDQAFEIILNNKEEECVVESFISSKDILQYEDIKEALKAFLDADDTSHFVIERLQISFNNFSDEIIGSVENGYRSKSIDISDGLRELVEVFCRGKVKRFCTHRGMPLYQWVLEKYKIFEPTIKEPKKWQNCGDEEKTNVLKICLENALKKILKKLANPRDCPSDISPVKVSEVLKGGVEDLFAVRSFDNADIEPSLFKGRLKLLMKFSKEAIRDYNPNYNLSSLDSYDHEIDFPETMNMRRMDENFEISMNCDHEAIIKDMVQVLTTKKGDPVRELERKLKFDKDVLLPPPDVDTEKWVQALLTVLSDEDHFDTPLEDSYKLVVDNDAIILYLAKECLFAFQRSRVECRIVEDSSIPENEIHLEKQTERQNVLEVSLSLETRKYIDKVCTGFTDCQTQLAPIFIPTTRPGPGKYRRGNFFLQENPWDTSEVETVKEEEVETAKEEKVAAKEEQNTSSLEFNIFLVVEKRHLEIMKSTIAEQTSPADRKINLKYIVLPQIGRGIGVTMAIIKSLAECFKFDVYWRVDDDIKFMYQFNEDDRRWHKCTFGRGLLFGQRVFHQCRQKTVRHLSDDEMDELVDTVLDYWPAWATKSRRAARRLLCDEKQLEKLKGSPGLLHSPFTSEIISQDCGESVEKGNEIRQIEERFVDECKARLFQSSVNHIAGVSLAHISNRKSDYMGNYPSAHFMPSKKRRDSQVVLHNTCALKGMNYVTDEVIFHEEENQIPDQNSSESPYWGVKDSDKFFCHALEAKGIIGFQVICINHVHEKRLVDVDRQSGHSHGDN